MWYECYECGTPMVKADEEVLVCPNCGHSVEIEDYTTEGDIYEQLYGGQNQYNDEIYWHDNEEFPGERYEDVYGDEENE